MMRLAENVGSKRMINVDKRQAIIITGPVGSGKTTVMATITEILEEQNRPCAGVDMDHLRWFYPKQPGDPFGGEVGRKNLAFVAANYRSMGVSIIAIADMVESDDDRQKLAEALPDFEVHVVRLRVPLSLVEERLRQRETIDRLPWYLDRAPELESIMDARNIGDTVIEVGERTPREVALEICRRVGIM